MSQQQVYEAITNQILELIEEGGFLPWERPWTMVWPMKAENGESYRGINIVILSMAAVVHEFKSPYWIGYKTAQKLGGNVKKGEKGTRIKYLRVIPKEKVEEAREQGKVISPFRHGYTTVFNLDQTEGIIVPELPEAPNGADVIQDVEEVLLRPMGELKIVQAGSEASYYPSLNTMYIPPIELFHSTVGRYSTGFHEKAHATGHRTLLNRFKEGEEYDKEPYAYEELVAQIAAMMVLGSLHVEEEVTFKRDTGYIANWAKRLKDSPKMIISASADAQRAADLILTGELPNYDWKKEKDNE